MKCSSSLGETYIKTDSDTKRDVEFELKWDAYIDQPTLASA